MQKLRPSRAVSEQNMARYDRNHSSSQAEPVEKKDFSAFSVCSVVEFFPRHDAKKKEEE